MNRSLVVVITASIAMATLVACGKASHKAADAAAASYNAAAAKWKPQIESQSAYLADYVTQMNLGEDTTAQTEAQNRDCAAAHALATASSSPPALVTAKTNGSSAYAAAQIAQRQLAAQASKLRTDLVPYTRLCDWYDASVIQTADYGAVYSKINSAPFTFTGSMTYAGKNYTCSNAAGCTTPDTSLYAQLATLWKQAGDDQGAGAAAVQKNHIPC